MPIVYTIDETRKLVETTATGEISGDEVAAYHTRLFADPAYRPEYNTLTDARRMTNLLSSEELSHLACQLDRRFVPHGTHRAVVVGSIAAFGMGRQFEGLTGGDLSPYRVFRTMEDARAWVGIDEG